MKVTDIGQARKKAKQDETDAEFERLLDVWSMIGDFCSDNQVYITSLGGSLKLNLHSNVIKNQSLEVDVIPF